MRQCERCGGDVSWTRDTVVLVGDVSVHLCNPCIREFEVLYHSSEEYAGLQENTARMTHMEHLAMAKTPVSEAECLANLLDREDLLRSVGKKARDFIAAVPSWVESVRGK